MIRKFLLLTAVLFVGLTSCDIDGEDDKKSSVDFIDQNLQGVISGQPWSFVAGEAESDTSDGVDIWRFSLYDVAPVEGFFGNSYDFISTVGFYIPKNIAVGVHELYLDFQAGESQVLTFYSKSTNLNSITESGTIEILNVDTTNNQISGRMSVWMTDDEENFKINGNFTVPIVD